MAAGKAQVIAGKAQFSAGKAQFSAGKAQLGPAGKAQFAFFGQSINASRTGEQLSLSGAAGKAQFGSAGRFQLRYQNENTDSNAECAAMVFLLKGFGNRYYT